MALLKTIKSFHVLATIGTELPLELIKGYSETKYSMGQIMGIGVSTCLEFAEGYSIIADIEARMNHDLPH